MNRRFLVRRANELKLEPDALAERCGVSKGYMKLVFKGLEPSRPTLILLAQNLKCSVDDLLAERAVGQAVAG